MSFGLLLHLVDFRKPEAEVLSSMNPEDVAGREPERTVGNLLRDRSLSLAVAESCTGGLLAHRITNIPGSSDYFDRGVVSYSNRSKRELLGVSERALADHGAVSEEVALEMAEGIREKSGADVGISTTGIAGPGGGTDEKPVGLVYIGLATSGASLAKRFNFSGDRLENKWDAASEGLNLLLESLASRS